ncbi:MAG: hypothetical protein ABIO21_17405 [Pseudomonas sp.]
MSTKKNISPTALIRASGHMRGKVEVDPAGTTLDCYTTEVHRDEADGRLHFWADMRVMGEAHTSLTISCVLRDKDLSTGSYPVTPVEHSQVVQLIYKEAPSAIGWEARAGEVTLRNFVNVDHLEGRLVFITREYSGKHFSMDVEFSIRGFDAKAGAK